MIGLKKRQTFRLSQKICLAGPNVFWRMAEIPTKDNGKNFETPLKFPPNSLNVDGPKMAILQRIRLNDYRKETKAMFGCKW